MTDNIELKDNIDETSDQSFNLTIEQWENSYIDIYEECSARTIFEKCLKEAIISKVDKKEYEDILNDANNRVRDMGYEPISV